MGEDKAHVFGGPLDHTTKLVRVEYVEFDRVKLQPIRDHLLDEFPNGIQENDGPERLQCGVRRLAGLGDDERGGLLEIIRPTACANTGVGQSR